MHYFLVASRQVCSIACMLGLVIVSFPLIAQTWSPEEMVVRQMTLQKDPMAGTVAPNLLLLHDLYQIHRVSGSATFENPVPSATIRDGMVRIEATSNEPSARPLIDELVALGLRDVKSFRHALNGWLPITAIRQMASLEHLGFVHQAYQPIYGSGIVTSQGDTA
ncbi:MAG: hypothetical protein R3301_19905, partial [Saprospiraceae bacterium]|nr:hypothetical protein [Saprospiraceae bacterium]